MAKMYVVTGKLGSGKTLYTVKKARDYLQAGRRVATNLDLNLGKLLSKKTDSKKLLRLADHPTAESFHNLGQAYSGSYDENKTGALILDECATWLNARDWNAKDRKQLINYLVHVRKKGWDVYLIIQDISMLDKQIRKVLAEHTVICRRTDRMKIPLFGVLFSMLGLDNKLPKAHIASIFYGDFQGAPLVATEPYLGKNLYNAYDTRQIFDETNNGYYTVLPPAITKKNYFVKWNLNKIMKLTQIYLRKYNALFLMSAAAIVSAALTFYFVGMEYDKKINDRLSNFEPLTNSPGTTPDILDNSNIPQDKPKPTLADSYKITGVMLVNQIAVYSLVSRENPELELTTESFESMGYKIKPRGSCEALAVQKSTGETQRLTCL